MADWDELTEALADYTVSCNANERLRKMQREWSRMLHFVCSDNGDAGSRWTSTAVRSSPRRRVTRAIPDILVTADSETFCDMFWGDLNPVAEVPAGRDHRQGFAGGHDAP